MVENASGDDSAARIRQWAVSNGVSCGAGPSNWLILLEAPGNGGYAAGNNIGLDWIANAGDASHVWVLNPDTLVTPTALTEMVARMAEDPAIGTCGALVCEMDEPGRVQCYAGGTFNRWIARSVDLGLGMSCQQPVDRDAVEGRLGYVVGACVLVSRAFLAAAGPMDERFFLYYEEIAWQRAAGSRFRPGFAPGAVIYHNRHSSGGLQERYLFANRLRFARWYQPWSLPLVAFGLIGTAIRALTRANWPRARLILSPGFWRLGLFG